MFTKNFIRGYSFNKSVDNLPNSIIYLSLSYSFNNKLDDLPIGLETLVIGRSFSHEINCLPKTLKFLEIKSRNYTLLNFINKNINICALPKNLEEITIQYDIYDHSGRHKIFKKFNIDNIKYEFQKEKIFLY